MTDDMRLWIEVLALSVFTDTIATVVMAKNGELFDGPRFWLINGLIVLLFAPSIYSMGWLLKIGAVPFVVTMGVWIAGVAVVNSVAGFLFLGNQFNWRSVAAIVGIVVCVYTLTTSEKKADAPTSTISEVSVHVPAGS